MRTRWHLLWALLPLLLACQGKEPLQPADEGTTTYKVAVLMPGSMKASQASLAKGALESIESAQKGLEHKVTLELEWIDEESAGFESEVKRVTHDAGYAAVIGPKYSRNARLVARESMAYRIPVLMPSVTSAEIQRIYAGSNKTEPNIFCMSESDLAQTQALLSLMRSNLFIHYVCLFCRADEGDDYTSSFNAYLPFLATELGFGEVIQFPFTDKASLRKGLKEIQGWAFAKYTSGIFFVPSSLEEMRWMDEILGEADFESDEAFPTVYCTDLAANPNLEGALKHEFEGVALLGDPESGFPAARQATTGTEIQSGYAQFYDCFTFLSLALAHKEQAGLETLNQAIVQLMDGNDGKGAPFGWTPGGLAPAFRTIRDGGLPSVAGASGRWLFDKETHISQLGSWYGYWRYADGRFHVNSYVTRIDGSLDQLWNWTPDGMEIQMDDRGVVYEELKDRYAVVMATSTGFTNYRHQADALDIYRLLRNAGYDDDHIVLITEDDLAGNKDNPHPGVVHVTPGGENLHQNIVNDYKISQITPEDLGNILAGKVTERTPQVVHGGKNTNVLFFWSGHGKYDNLFNWGADGTITSDQIHTILQGAQDNFRKMLFVMETCYSGSLGEGLPQIPGLLLLTACAPGEKSHADVLENSIYLSNAFTRVFRETVEKNPEINFYNLYTELVRHTTASHAMLYNYNWYGSVYARGVDEYFMIR